jgi:UDP-N-acetylmuramoyl-tripeptide--D-alanyl-D-alanine ligase
VANADDPRIMQRIGRFVGRTLTFGTAAGATVRASEIEDRGIDGMAALVTTPVGAARMTTPLLGRGNLANVLAAATVAIDSGVPLDVVTDVASRLTPADRRGDVRRLRDGVVVIDDSYNSSPAALRRALEVVKADTKSTRKIAVLGEMLELGEHAEALHQESGRAAAAAGVQLLFTVGDAPARTMADAARDAGIPVSSVRHFDTSDEAARVVAQAVRPGDLVLIKGSRGTRTDLVVDRIVAEHG